MSERCEPPEALGKYEGYHWCMHANGTPSVLFWFGDGGGEWSFRLEPVSPEYLAAAGYRYLSPVPSPGKVAALVRAARDARSELQKVPEIDRYEHRLNNAEAIAASLDAALAPFADVAS